jgi:hypothetical protein
MTTAEQAQAIKDYMDFRAQRENVKHGLGLDFYCNGIEQGIVYFFGVTLGPDGLTSDIQTPALFREWMASNGHAKEVRREEHRKDVSDLADAVYKLARTDLPYTEIAHSMLSGLNDDPPADWDYYFYAACRHLEELRQEIKRITTSEAHP